MILYVCDVCQKRAPAEFSAPPRDGDAMVVLQADKPRGWKVAQTCRTVVIACSKEHYEQRVKALPDEAERKLLGRALEVQP